MLNIIYRICDINSTNPAPVFPDDRHELNKLCFDRFLRAFCNVNATYTFLLDNALDDWEDIIDSRMTNFKIERSSHGINYSFLRAMELGKEVGTDCLFQECDYLYNGVVGKKMVRAIDELELVSPYNHLNFYVDHGIHSRFCQIELVGDHIYRSTERNTMTWGCHSKLVKQYKDIFDRYGYLDDQVWSDLRHAGYNLYVPIPSFATHMVADWLAPEINWEKVS